jgi:hypothetical protein
LLQEELESVLSAWFKQAHECNASIDGTQLKEKHPTSLSMLEPETFSASNGWINRFKHRNKIFYRTLSGWSTTVDSETGEDWKYY